MQGFPEECKFFCKKVFSQPSRPCEKRRDSVKFLSSLKARPLSFVRKLRVSTNRRLRRVCPWVISVHHRKKTHESDHFSGARQEL